MASSSLGHLSHFNPNTSFASNEASPTNESSQSQRIVTKQELFKRAYESQHKLYDRDFNEAKRMLTLAGNWGDEERTMPLFFKTAKEECTVEKFLETLEKCNLNKLDEAIDYLIDIRNHSIKSPSRSKDPTPLSENEIAELFAIITPEHAAIKAFEGLGLDVEESTSPQPSKGKGRSSSRSSSSHYDDRSSSSIASGLRQNLHVATNITSSAASFEPLKLESVFSSRSTSVELRSTSTESRSTSVDLRSASVEFYPFETEKKPSSTNLVFKSLKKYKYPEAEIDGQIKLLTSFDNFFGDILIETRVKNSISLYKLNKTLKKLIAVATKNTVATQINRMDEVWDHLNSFLAEQQRQTLQNPTLENAYALEETCNYILENLIPNIPAPEMLEVSFTATDHHAAVKSASRTKEYIDRYCVPLINDIKLTYTGDYVFTISVDRTVSSFLYSSRICPFSFVRGWQAGQALSFAERSYEYPYNPSFKDLFKEVYPNKGSFFTVEDPNSKTTYKLLHFDVPHPRSLKTSRKVLLQIKPATIAKTSEAPALEFETHVSIPKSPSAISVSPHSRSITSGQLFELLREDSNPPEDRQDSESLADEVTI